MRGKTGLNMIIFVVLKTNLFDPVSLVSSSAVHWNDKFENIKSIHLKAGQLAQTCQVGLLLAYAIDITQTTCVCVYVCVYVCNMHI